MSVLQALRVAPWLTADRALSYGRLIGAACLLFLVAALGKILIPAFSDAHWRPLASDFDPFWSGARLALSGHPASAYDLAAIRAMEDTGAQAAGTEFYYLYPPVWLLLCLPLAALPYVLALPVFLLAGYAAFVACVRAILPRGWPFLSVLAFPAAILNAVIGQNGFVSATCFAGAMLLLDRSPILAGGCLGLFAYKPQLAICVPVALLAARRWSALVACGATALMLLLLSWAVLGTTSWQGFFAAAPFIRAVLQDPGIWPKLVSVFTGIRLLGAGLPLALAVQSAAALCALACVVRVSFRRPGAGAEVATLVAAAMLCTPYVMDYDLVCLAVPMAWLVACARSGAWWPWEKTALAALYLVPLCARMLNVAAGVPTMPILLVVLLALTVRRALAAPVQR